MPTEVIKEVGWDSSLPLYTLSSVSQKLPYQAEQVFRRFFIEELGQIAKRQ